MRNKLFMATLAAMAATLAGCGYRSQPANQLTLGDTVPAKDFEPKDSVDSLLPNGGESDMNSTFIFNSDAATTMEVKMLPSLHDTILQKDEAIQIHGNLEPGDTITVVFGHGSNGERTVLDVQKKQAGKP